VIIKSLAVGPIQAVCYIVGCESTGKAAVIDPGDEAARILELVGQAQLEVDTIINTHGHFDHVGGNSEMKSATGAPILIHAEDAPMLGQLSAAAAAWGLQAQDSPEPDRLVSDGEHITVGSLDFTVIHTPGHTRGGISLLCDDSVFVGDTLFAGSIGRTDFPGGDYDTLITSIRSRLFVLDDAVTVYPGHMGTTTIGREKQTNPFAGLR